MLAAVALAREHVAGTHGPRAVRRAVREVSSALGNTPKVARDSYIDPRVIDAYERGTVIEMPAGTPDAAVPLRIETRQDGVVIELPTDVAGDAVREEIERRVRDLLASDA